MDTRREWKRYYGECRRAACVLEMDVRPEFIIAMECAMETDRLEFRAILASYDAGTPALVSGAFQCTTAQNVFVTDPYTNLHHSDPKQRFAP